MCRACVSFMDILRLWFLGQILLLLQKVTTLIIAW